MRSDTSSSGEANAALLEETSVRLLAAARRGHPSALDRLFSRQLAPLKRWAHGRLPQWARSMADTADLVQDAVLRTLGRLDGFEPRGRHALGAYLREAVRNRIRDEHRRIARRGVAFPLVESDAGSAPSPLQSAMTHAMEARYRRALSRLNPVERELIVAHLELDYSHEQLGCMLGRSRDAARMALRRAITRLAEEMRDR
jgi:RNA polymerase sigma-70 factor (ECF subfamily)